MTDSSLDLMKRKKPSTLWSRLDRILIDEFNPSFFSSVMGTGICANLCNAFPYPARWLMICSHILFAIAAILFVANNIFMVACCLRHRGMFTRYHTDIKISVYIGAYAMAYSTLVNYTFYLVKGHKHGPIAVFVLWWIGVILSVYSACITFYFSYLSKLSSQITLEDVNTTLLMPLVTLIVSGLSANTIVMSLPSTRLKVLTLVMSFMLWSNGVITGFMFTALYFHKLLFHKIPDTGAVFSSFLPVGFLGQAGYCIIYFGQNCHKVLMEVGAPKHYFQYLTEGELGSSVTPLIIGNSIFMPAACTGLLFITFGYFMTFILVASVLSKIHPFASTPNLVHTRNGFITFTRGFWTMTFPVGSLAFGNIQFHEVFGEGFGFFRVMGSIYSVTVFLVTVGCLMGVVYRFCTIVVDRDVGEEGEDESDI